MIGASPLGLLPLGTVNVVSEPVVVTPPTYGTSNFAVPQRPSYRPEEELEPLNAMISSGQSGQKMAAIFRLEIPAAGRQIQPQSSDVALWMAMSMSLSQRTVQGARSSVWLTLRAAGSSGQRQDSAMRGITTMDARIITDLQERDVPLYEDDLTQFEDI